MLPPSFVFFGSGSDAPGFGVQVPVPTYNIPYHTQL